MDLKEARQKLYDKMFLLGGSRQKAALKYLMATHELEAVDVLVEALEKHEKPKRVKEAIMGIEDGAKVDRLWQHWAGGRLASLGEIIKKKRQRARDAGLKTLSMIKIGREAELPQDRKTLQETLDLATDTDAEVREGVVRFTFGIQDLSLRTIALFKLGREADLPKDRKTLRAVLDLATDADADVRKGVARFVAGLKDPILKLLVMLKLGRCRHSKKSKNAPGSVGPDNGYGRLCQERSGPFCVRF